MNRREFILSGICTGAMGIRAESSPAVFSFLQATDLHMTENPDIERGALQMKDKFMGPCFIDAVNALGKEDPSVAFIALTGDLTSGVDMNPSCWPFAERKWRHYRRYVTDRLAVPWHQILGNNDCAAAPYEAVFPECPLFWSFEKGGILFAALHGYACWKVENTNHAGIRYDAEQLDWLKRLFETSSARSLVLFTHEPLLCDDSHVARTQLAPVLSKFRGEEIWNIAGHEHRNHTATFMLGGRLVRSVETMTPVGEWKVGKGCFRQFCCADGRIVGAKLHWTDLDGKVLEVTEDRTIRDSGPAVLLEDSFPKEALSVCLVGRDHFVLGPKTRRVEDRIADYYVSRPVAGERDSSGILQFDVPERVGGRKVASVLFRTNRETKRLPVPLPDREGRRFVTFENDTMQEVKFFGYALCPQPVPLITSAPVLQNAAQTSVGVAFAVSADASGWVEYSRSPDMTDATKVFSGAHGMMEVDDRIACVRLTGLKPAVTYYYRIGADRISYAGGYAMKNLGSERDAKVHSFTTLGAAAKGSFCVINDTHEMKQALDLELKKVAELKPAVVVWNGDASNVTETVDQALDVFVHVHPDHPEYAADTPYMFLNGNHDFRGRFNRRLGEVMMYREPAERKGEYAELGRNFVQRLGDICLIGLDTGEDKLDTNPHFAGIFRMQDYREKQTKWLAEAIETEAVKTSKFKVVFCHIPLFDPRPDANPGDLAPADKDSRYKKDYAAWQRTCARLWGPSLKKAGVQLVVVGHQHRYRYDAPTADRPWAQIVGGGPDFGVHPTWIDGKLVREPDDSRFPTVIEVRVEGGRLVVRVHDLARGSLAGRFEFG